MPFIIIVGQPSTGKTHVCNQLKEYFTSKGKTVDIICETDVLLQMHLTRNKAYSDSRIEKEIRGVLKTEVLRRLNPETLLVLDGLNYIKGFRYELYCGTKTSKTTSCTVHCEPGPEKAWQLNIGREEEEQYSRVIFDALVQRYEAPESRNRWDSPMVTVVDSGNIAYGDIEAALYDRKPPPPNQSTQCPPLSDTNFLHQVDKSVQAIIADITSVAKMGVEGEITVSGTSEKLLLSGDRNTSLPQLMRLKRQFIVYVKAHPELSAEKIPLCFVRYLNTNL